MNADNYIIKIQNFSRAWTETIKRLSPIVAVVAQSFLFALIVFNAVGGFTGLILGSLIGAGLDMSGMQVIGTAVKKRNFWWTVFSIIYIAAHGGALFYLETTHGLEGEVAVLSFVLLIASVLAYIARGEYSKDDDAQNNVVNQFNQMLSEAEALRDAGMKLDKNGRIVPIPNRSKGPAPSPVQSEKSPVLAPAPEVASRKLRRSDLNPEQIEQLKIVSCSDFCSQYGVNVAKSTYSDWQRHFHSNTF